MSRRTPDKNATVIRVCRRLVQAAQESQLIVRWVKVKGHSEEEGNDAADEAANWAQNGGSKGEQDIETIIDYLRDGTQPRHPDEQTQACG